MRCIEIADGTTIAHDEILESPFVAKDGLKQTVRTTAGVIIEALIGTHYLAYLTILYQLLEGRHISLPEVAHGYII